MRGLKIEEGWGGDVTIDMPSRKQWAVLLYFPVWLTFWACGESAVLRTIVGGATQDHSPSADEPVKLFVGILVSIFAGLGILVVWLWNAFGREVIRLRGDRLTVSRTVFQIGPRWEMGRSSLRRVALCPAETTAADWYFTQPNNFLGMFGVDRPTLAFEAGVTGFRGAPRVWRVGSGLRGAEAETVADVLRRHAGSDAQLR